MAASGWVFTGELIAALTRLGKMPVIFESIGEYYGRLRIQKYANGEMAWHDDLEVPRIPPCVLGERYIDAVSGMIRRMEKEERKNLDRARAWVYEAREAGRRLIMYSMGHIFPGEISVNYIVYDGKEYNCSFIRDITERKKVEDAFRVASAYNRSLIEASLDPLLTIAPDGRITDVNAATEAVTGYSREALVGTVFSDYFTDPAKAREGYLMVFREGSVTDYSLEIRHRDGRVTPVIYNASVYRDEAGNVTGVFAAARDITERKRAEDALQESEEKFRVLAETTRAGIMLFRGTNVVYANPALERISGYSKDELLKMKYWEVADPEQQEMVRSRGLSCQLGHPSMPATCEIKTRSRSGETRWVELSVALVDYHGRQTGLATMFDITDRKRSEAELHEAKGQVELYLDLMGHDINNLNQIGIGFLDMALATLKLDRESRELIARPLEALEASSRLIANVRKLKTVREGGLKFKEVRLARKLREIIPRYSDVPGREVRISLDAGCDCTVMANDLLDDVFANIIHNAIKHSTGPLTIEVHLSTAKIGDQKYALVAIEDDGPGIPDERKSQLFTRSGNSHARATGRGLGLHLVRTLVEDFRGKVWAEDRVRDDPSKGTRFVIMLPATV
jgi:PAS domain S-box-containing protein